MATNKEVPLHRNPDKLSMIVAALVSLGVVIWAAVTHYRVPINESWLPAPTQWYTAAIPTLLALLTLSIGVVLLGWSASRAFRHEGMGVGDMFTAVVQAGVVTSIALLMAFGVIKFGPNFLLGIVSFEIASVAELLATLIVWGVANRRTFGMGAPASAH